MMNSLLSNGILLILVALGLALLLILHQQAQWNIVPPVIIWTVVLYLTILIAFLYLIVGSIFIIFSPTRGLGRSLLFAAGMIALIGIPVCSLLNL